MQREPPKNVHGREDTKHLLMSVGQRLQAAIHCKSFTMNFDFACVNKALFLTCFYIVM